MPIKSNFPCFCVFRFEKDRAQAKPPSADRTEVSLDKYLWYVSFWINSYMSPKDLFLNTLWLMESFTAFRYFEEFEKRIPRAEMELMEVVKHFDCPVIIKQVLFKVLIKCVSFFRHLYLGSWRRLVQNTLEQSVEVTGEVNLPFRSVIFSSW